MSYKKEAIIKAITDNLAFSSKSTTLKNIIGLFDSNRIAQDFFTSLFSLIFDYNNLKDLDKLNDVVNYPAIDLGDKEARVAFQITTQSDSDKIKDTISKFIKHNLYKTYDRLIIFIIGEKRGYTTTAESWKNIKKLVHKNFHYPVIIKPEIGLRGQGIETSGVEKIHSDHELKKYLNQTNGEFLIEEFLDFPLEFGVFYIKKPWKKSGEITSLMERKFLYVTGNGEQTLKQLIQNHSRAKNYQKDLFARYHQNLKTVVPRKEKFLLGEIGNHCRGTKFCDVNHKITAKMESSFDEISKQFAGFNYGRYDVKANSWQDLENGNVKIIELNGFFAEPGCVYDPKNSLWTAYKKYLYHISLLSKISRYNNQIRKISYINLIKEKKY